MLRTLVPVTFTGKGTRPRRSAFRGAVVVVLSTAVLVACSDDRPAPDEAAAATAAGLSALDLTEVPLAPATATQAAEQMSAAVAELGDLRPTVTVQSVDEPEDVDGTITATAVLGVSWDLDASEQDWTYTTAADLTYVEDAWQVAWSPALLEPSLVAGERLVLGEVAAERAGILGADGAVLVADRPVMRVGIDKTRVEPAQAAGSAAALAELVGIDPAAFSARVEAAGTSAFVEAIVLRADGSYPLEAAAVAAIPGAVEIPDEIPLAPTREFARPILGTVGEATAEVIAESDGELEVGDVVGMSGLQEAYDEQLRGRPGLTVEAVPPEGTSGEPRELFGTEPTPGEPVVTTLAPGLQTLAEEVLAPVGTPSAVVALRPSTGDVLAAASGPGSAGYSTALLGRYPPGSTFKVVSTLALLDAGLTPSTTVSCPETITVDGREFENYDDYPAGGIGDITLRTALANSCNTAFIGAADTVGQAALTEAAAALGLGVERDLGLPAFPGSVPADAGATEHAASMIGQGRIEASPLAMATVAASIAQGATVVPRLVVEPPVADAAATSTLEAADAQAVRDMMSAVVGEGSATFLADVPGEPVGAKTGTAEYGTEDPPRTHAWMIAVHGDLAVAVFVEDGGSGSQTAGPLLESFLRGAASG